MAIGIEQREQLAQQMQRQYKEKRIPLQIAGLELALRAHARWEKRFDQGLLTWEQLQEQRGKTNGMVVGIARALHESNGWTLQALQMWKTFHSPYWTIIEEPAFIREALQPYVAKAIPSIVSTNMTLNIFHKSIVAYQQQSEPLKKSSAKAAMDKLFQGMLKTPLEEKARDLLFLCGEHQEPRYGWLNQLQEMRTPEPSATPPKTSGLRRVVAEEVEDVEFRDLPPEELDITDDDMDADIIAALQQEEVAPPVKTSGLRKSSSAQAPDGMDPDEFAMLTAAAQIAPQAAELMENTTASMATPKKSGLRRASTNDNPELEVGMAHEQQDHVAASLGLDPAAVQSARQTAPISATRDHKISAQDLEFLATMDL